MLDLSKYQSVGAALHDACEQFADEICLIEADRDRENHRLTYRQFKEQAESLAKALQDGGFRPGDRAAILMTNQSKWLISAYAIFFCGGVLVPLDLKRQPEELWQLLRHSGASVLVAEYKMIWRELSVAEGRTAATDLRAVLMTEAPANADLAGAARWEETKGNGQPMFVARERKDAACIVYTSGTG